MGDGVDVIVLTGAAGTFCAGADLSTEALYGGVAVPSAADNLAVMAAPGAAAGLAGKLVALQDLMAKVVADGSNRQIKNVIQRVTSAVFFPI